jgi:hypothetical protein
MPQGCEEYLMSDHGSDAGRSRRHDHDQVIDQRTRLPLGLVISLLSAAVVITLWLGALQWAQVMLEREQRRLVEEHQRDMARYDSELAQVKTDQKNDKLVIYQIATDIAVIKTRQETESLRRKEKDD